MKLLGIPDGVEKPIIKANGISIAAVMIEQQVGELATCSFQIPPEFEGSFSTNGMLVTIDVKSKSCNGTVFKGKLQGTGFSNMTGNISCRVDLVHEIGSKLDTSSTLFPGHMPGSAFDNEAFIKQDNRGTSNSLSAGSTLLPLTLANDFGEDIKKFILDYIKVEVTSSTEMQHPGEVDKVKEAITALKSYTGQIISPNIVISGITEDLNGVLKGASVSSTFWNVLSQFFSSVDLVFSCKLDGELMLIPNLSGVKAGEGHAIPKEWVITFDQSSKYERTPKSVTVLVDDLPPGESTGMKFDHRVVGQAEVENAPAGASGVFSVIPPKFLRSMTQKGADAYGPVMNAYAKLVGIRETAKFKTCNVTCPLILDIFPGVPATFEHLTSIKSFSGDKISGFNKKFDGYVWKISHEISTEGFPKTILSMSNVSSGDFTKAASHPFWAGAKIPAW